MNKTDFIKALEAKHKEAIERIKLLIDVETQEYPEYKAAATLCKFLYDSEDRYAMIHEPDMFSGFYDNAQDFETLCSSIYHSLTDDGEITFVQVNNHCPVIVFENRWELKQDDLISKNEEAMYERLNEFKKKKNILPLHEHKIVFFDDVYSYIEAVKQYRIDYEIQIKRLEEWKKLNKRLAGRENPNLDEVEFGTPHLKED
jgi:hypothetical protein